MKKIIFMIMFGLLCTVIQAQVHWLKATNIATKVASEGYWSDWETVNIDIKFDVSNDVIIIYSSRTQIYKILKQLESPYDAKGTQIMFKVIDQDGDIGSLRLRTENSGSSQIYFDFSDISWVYAVKKLIKSF